MQKNGTAKKTKKPARRKIYIYRNLRRENYNYSDSQVGLIGSPTAVIKQGPLCLEIKIGYDGGFTLVTYATSEERDTAFVKMIEAMKREIDGR